MGISSSIIDFICIGLLLKWALLSRWKAQLHVHDYHNRFRMSKLFDEVQQWNQIKEYWMIVRLRFSLFRARSRSCVILAQCPKLNERLWSDLILFLPPLQALIVVFASHRVLPQLCVCKSFLWDRIYTIKINVSNWTNVANKFRFIKLSSATVLSFNRFHCSKILQILPLLQNVGVSRVFWFYQIKKL